MSLITGLDYLTLFIVALTGALAASRARLDPVGFSVHRLANRSRRRHGA